MTNREPRDVMENRATVYAVNVFKFQRTLPYDVSTKVITCQLGKSATSIGANCHEANCSDIRDDFTHKISIAVKSSNKNLIGLISLKAF